MLTQHPTLSAATIDDSKFQVFCDDQPSCESPIPVSDDQAVIEAHYELGYQPLEVAGELALFGAACG